MAGSTSNRALRYPTGGDTPNIHGDILNLATDVDTQLGSGRVPPVLTSVVMVAFQPAPLLTLAAFTGASPGDLQQSAALVYLPGPIASATRIRWRYKHGNPAITGNYVFGIYSAAGAKLIDTGSVAFTGAATTTQTRSETIAATTFAPGWYYLLFGADVTNVGTGTMEMLTWRATATNTPYPNANLTSATGGVTAPATLAAFTDGGSLQLDVPVCALSVG